MPELSSRQRKIFIVVIAILVVGALGTGAYALFRYRAAQQARTSLVDISSLTDIPIITPPPAPAPSPTTNPTPTPTPTQPTQPQPTTQPSTPSVTQPQPPVVAAPTTPSVTQPRPTATTPTTPTTTAGTSLDNNIVANGAALPEESPEAGISTTLLVLLAAVTSLTLMGIFVVRQNALRRI